MLKPVRIALAVLGATLALLLAACGSGGQDVPASAVAVVNGTPISRSELDGWLAQAKKSYQAQKQQFPKVGTPEYQSIETRYVAYLVQKAEFEQAAKDLGIKVTKQDVDQGLSDYIKAKFGGSRKNFEKALAAQDFPESTFRQTIALSVLSNKIYEAVTKDVNVPEQDALAYYNQNLSNYQKLDFTTSRRLAVQLWQRLKAGESFASLAKKYSADPSSASKGGKATFTQGQTVPEFDKVAFALKTGQLSKPVKSSTYGYFIIKALSNVKPGHGQQKASRAVQYILIKQTKATPFAKVADSIRATLLQQRKQEAMTTWAQDLAKKYKSKVRYASGFEPPQIPSSTDTSSQ